MHSPRPYGLLVQGDKLSDRDKLFIDQELKKLTNQKTLSNLDSIRQVKNLPDGGYVVLQDMGGILKAIAFKGNPLDSFIDDGLANIYVPMLYSGLINKVVVRADEGVNINLTEQTRYRLNAYENENLPKKKLDLFRFVVDMNLRVVPEFFQPNSGESKITQYASQKPTWYSGAMQEVMQIVGGFGKQNINDLPDLPEERAQFKIPSKYFDEIHNQISGVRLPCYTGIPASNGQFQYDYKFERTHAVVFDDLNKPWLVQISKFGVWAMPLPIVPATVTSAFRDYIEEVNDEEILKILDRFGGMPTGESFPENNKDFMAWVRAGVIVNVCEIKEFYEKIAIYDACGWSLNLNGTEGFNTCYEYNNDGIKVGYAYKIKFDFSHADNIGWLSKVEVNQEHASIISNYISMLFDALPSNSHKTKAIKYKLRRVDQKDIYARAVAYRNSTQLNTELEVNYWDNLTLKPIAVLKGSANVVSSGYLFHPAKFESQPQIKFPDKYISGCLSFNFSPENPINRTVRCDTIIFGFYEGNSLKVVKYFYDSGTYFRDVESNFEECMIVGEWQETVTEGVTSLLGNFYTSDLDDRSSQSPKVTVTKIKGEDKGYDSKPNFSQDGFFYRTGKIWRNRYYTHKVNTTTTQNNFLEIGCCVPTNCRNSVVHANRNSYSSAFEAESYDSNFVTDPYSYSYWTHDPLFAYIGGLSKMTGKPDPKDGSPVWVEIETYAPSTCSDFADQGSWIPNLPADYTWLIHPNRFEWRMSGGGGAPKVNKYSTFKNIPGQVFGKLHFNVNGDARLVHNQVPQDAYFLAVPSEELAVFICNAYKVVFGDTEYANISEIVDGKRKYWGYSSLLEHESNFQFIGVINE